jgi:hypothetical protein
VATILLGVLEGAILARIFQLKLSRCSGFMIPANVLTSWIGLSILRTIPGPDLRRDVGPALVYIVILFALTLLLEWPFVALSVRGAPGWFRRSVRGSLIAQSASYGVLVIIGFIAALGLPDRDAGAVAGMKSDLRNLVTAQESYFTDHSTYADSLASLRTGGSSYEASSGNVVRIIQASATGWSAIIRKEPPENPALMEQEAFWTTKTCGIFEGTATPPIPGQNEGEPQCR